MQNVTATLTLKLQTLGEAGLQAAIKGLDKTAVAAAKAGHQLEETTKETTRLGEKAKPLNTLEKELVQIGRAAEQAKIKMAAKEIFFGPNGEPPIIPKLRSIEHEMQRLDRLANNRAVTAAARERLGGGKPGGFLSGHGFLTTGRQVIGAMRDITVAGMGARFVLGGMVNATEQLIEPMRKFESSMAETRNKGGFTVEQMKGIEEAARNVGKTTAFRSTAAADAAVELAAAGLSADSVQTAIPVALKFAASGGLNTADSATLLSDTMSQFGLKATDMERIGNTLTKAANMSTISVAQIGDSLKYVGPIASTAGISLEQLSGMVALLGSRGVKASEAGTGMRKLLTSLVHPTKQAQQAMRMVGLSKDDMQKGLSDLPGFMAKLSNSMTQKNFGSAQKLEVSKLLFGTEGLVAADILMKAATESGKDGKNAIESFTAALKDANGEMQRNADTMGNTLNGRIEAMNARFESLKLTLTDKLKPALMAVFEGTAAAIGKIDTAFAKAQSASDYGQAVGNILFGTKKEQEERERLEKEGKRGGAIDAVAFGGSDSANPLVQLGSFLYGLNNLENDREAKDLERKNLEKEAKFKQDAVASATSPGLSAAEQAAALGFNPNAVSPAVSGEIQITVTDERVMVASVQRGGVKLPVGRSVAP